MKYFYFVIILFCSLVVQGQIMNVEGNIVDSNGIKLQSIHIMNRSSNTGTTTNKEGHFVISASINDTLAITSIQHKKLIVIVRDKHINQGIHLILKEDNTLLSDIILFPRVELLKRKIDDNREIKLSLPFKNNLEKRPYIERQFDVLKPKVSLSETGLGFSASLLGGLTKEYKEIKTLKRTRKEDEYIDLLYKSFNEKFYTKTLELPEGTHLLFIEYCLKEDPDLKRLVSQKDIYMIIDRVKYQAINFKIQYKR